MIPELIEKLIKNSSRNSFKIDTKNLSKATLEKSFTLVLAPCGCLLGGRLQALFQKMAKNGMKKYTKKSSENDTRIRRKTNQK